MAINDWRAVRVVVERVLQTCLVVPWNLIALFVFYIPWKIHIHTFKWGHPSPAIFPKHLLYFQNSSFHFHHFPTYIDDIRLFWETRWWLVVVLIQEQIIVSLCILIWQCLKKRLWICICSAFVQYAILYLFLRKQSLVYTLCSTLQGNQVSQAF